MRARACCKAARSPFQKALHRLSFAFGQDGKVFRCMMLLMVLNAAMCFSQLNQHQVDAGNRRSQSQTSARAIGSFAADSRQSLDMYAWPGL